MPLFLVGGALYELVGDCLFKAARYQVGDTKTGPDGRQWVFAETKRWRLAEGAKKSKSKKSKPKDQAAQPVSADSSGKKQGRKQVQPQERSRSDSGVSPVAAGFGSAKDRAKSKQQGEKVNEQLKPRSQSSPKPVSDDEALDIINQLDQELKTDGYLPIFHFREKLKGMPREEQDQLLYRLQRSDKIELSSLVEGRHYTDEQLKSGIPQDAGGPLFFIMPSDVDQFADIGQGDSDQLKPRSQSSPKDEGGAIAPSGGKLAPRAKGGQEAPKEDQVRTPHEEVHAKYASDNPSDQDAKNWLDEIIRVPPTEEKIHEQVLDQVKRESGLHESHFFDKNSDKARAAAGIVDKESWLNAAFDQEKEHHADHQTWVDSPDAWKRFSFRGDGEREKMARDADRWEQQIKDGKAKDPAKLQKKIDKTRKDLKDDRESSEFALNTTKKRMMRSDDEIRRDLNTQYDTAFANQMKSAQKLHLDLTSGKPKAQVNARMALTDKVLRSLPGYDWMSDDHTETIKDFLRSQATPDHARLGIPKKGFTKQELKAAYRAAALKSHPDHGGSEEEFRSISDAYQRLMPMAKSLFELNGYLYRLEGNYLIKAGKKTSPGQMSLFDQGGDSQWDESKHARSGDGKFTSGGGGAPKKVMDAIADADQVNSAFDETASKSRKLAQELEDHKEKHGSFIAHNNAVPFNSKTEPKVSLDHAAIAKSHVKSLKDMHFEGKLSAQDASDYGIDAAHPGNGWDEDVYEDHLDAYRKGGAAGLGKKVLSDGNGDPEDPIRGAIAQHALKSVDWDHVHQSLNAALSGAKPSSADPLTNVVMNHAIDLADAAKDDEDYLSDVRRIAANPQSVQKYYSRLLSSEDDDQWDLESDLFDHAHSGGIDPEELGTAIAQGMGLDKAHQYEQSTGRSLRHTQFENTKAGMEQAATSKIIDSTDWVNLSQALKDGTKPSDPKSKFIADVLKQKHQQSPLDEGDWDAPYLHELLRNQFRSSLNNSPEHRQRAIQIANVN